jgi:hypothetical protein
MSTTSTSTSAVVAVAEPMVTSQERLALAGFLASRRLRGEAVMVAGLDARHERHRPLG